MSRATLLASFSAAILITVAALSAQNDPMLTAKLDTGTVSGIPGASASMHIFKGIPYAAPPVGDQRWRAPQPAAKWEGVRKADQFSPTCMQGSGNGSSEDCLYVNVWTAAKSPSERRPVMVFIYGGGYTSGAGSEPRYDSEALASKGAVMVTFNYRLGIFGFFAHPDLTKESDRRAAGNFGMMDSVAALQWVQRNIAAFGGDPKRVTIFGESAGAGLVANLQASPRAKGLFQRALGESSSWTTATISKLSNLADAEQAGVKFADGLGAKSIAELRAKPAADVMKAGRGQGPIVDGWWIPEDPGAVFAAGRQNDVPVLAGSNRDESFGAAPRDLAGYIENAKRRFGDLADLYLKTYPATTDQEAKDAAFFSGRDEMAFVMRNWARLGAKAGKQKSYVFLFTHQPPAVPGAKGGGAFGPTVHGSATHTAELAYVFNVPGNRPWTEVDRQVADTMGSYWVNFATNGDPNGKGLPQWPAFDGAKNKNAMIFGDKAEAGAGPTTDAQIAFFQAYYDKLAGK